MFLPFGNDLMLIALISRNRAVLPAIAYVVASALGSMLGVFVIDTLSRKTGEKGLERFVSPEKVDRLRERLENKAGLTVFVATLMPPPFPFTPVIMTAAALQCSRGIIIAAVGIGRLVRFTIEALLAIYFGQRVIAILNSPVVTYFVYALIGVAIVGSALSVWRWLKRSSE